MRAEKRGKPTGWVPPDHENRLAEFRTKAGLTVTALAGRIGIGHASLRAVELGTVSPMYPSGRTKEWVGRACDELGRLIEDVFPHHFCAWRPDELVPEQIYGDIMRREPPDIDDVIDARDAIRLLYKLNKKRALAVWMVCCGYGLDEVAHVLGVSKSRAGQIEAKGMRIIRQSFANKGEVYRDVAPKRTHVKKSPDNQDEMVWSKRALWVRGGKVGPEPK